MRAYQWTQGSEHARDGQPGGRPAVAPRQHDREEGQQRQHLVLGAHRDAQAEGGDEQPAPAARRVAVPCMQGDEADRHEQGHAHVDIGAVVLALGQQQPESGGDAGRHVVPQVPHAQQIDQPGREPTARGVHEVRQHVLAPEQRHGEEQVEVVGEPGIAQPVADHQAAGARPLARVRQVVGQFAPRPSAGTAARAAWAGPAARRRRRSSARRWCGRSRRRAGNAATNPAPSSSDRAGDAAAPRRPARGPPPPAPAPASSSVHRRCPAPAARRPRRRSRSVDRRVAMGEAIRSGRPFPASTRAPRPRPPGSNRRPMPQQPNSQMPSSAYCASAKTERIDDATDGGVPRVSPRSAAPGPRARAAGGSGSSGKRSCASRTS